MRVSAFTPSILLRCAAAALALAALAVPALRAQDSYDPSDTSAQSQDPPDQAGRVSALSGTVSIQPSGTDNWGQAYPNLPIGPGDRIYTDRDGQAEIQIGQTYLRLGPNADITLIGATQDSISWGISQGSVHIRSFGLWQGQTLNFSTPNGDAQVSNPGELRIDALPDQNSTIFTSINSGVALSGAGDFYQQLGNGQSLALYGSNPVYPQWLQPAAADQLDQWSQQQDQAILNAAAYRYVNPEVPGASELDGYGDWSSDTDYGPMWFPRATPADWQPYHNGHWINRDPWGWVWVEDEPWGYAPFHYGRWVVYRNRWGWVPGPRDVRPVWSPALVVFAGGIHAGGASLSVWFPLGPGEAYRPWYRCSPRYIDRVNITNIRESRMVRVQKTYINITNVTYVNRANGVTAMRPDDFAAGRSARQGAVQVDRRQFDRVQVVDHPAPVTRQSFVTRPVARPVPVATHTPVFINRQGMQISAKPGAAPVAPPQMRNQPPQRQLPGRTVVAPPQNSRFQNGNPQPRGNPNGNGNRQEQPNNGSPAQNPSQRPVIGQPVGRPATPINGRGLVQEQPQQNQPPAPNPPAGTNPQQPHAPDARPIGRPAAPINGRGLVPPQSNQNPAAPAQPQPTPQQPRNQPPAQQQPDPQQNHRQEPAPAQPDRHEPAAPQQAQPPRQMPQPAAPQPQKNQPPARQDAAPAQPARPQTPQPNRPADQPRPNQPQPDQPRPAQPRPDQAKPNQDKPDQARPDRKDNRDQNQKKDQKDKNPPKKDEKKNDK